MAKEWPYTGKRKHDIMIAAQSYKILLGGINMGTEKRQLNICGERIKIARSKHNPPLSRWELANRVRLLGLDLMSEEIIARIEENQRRVCDAELWAIARALDKSMDWLTGRENV